jgi:hypothetical protein
MGGANPAFEGSLVAPEAQPLVGGEGAKEGEEVRRANPEAVLAREESATKYEGLDSGEADELAREAFPGLVDDPGGGPPQLPAGQHIAGFVDGTAAQVELGEGQDGVIESTAPMALASSPGPWLFYH